MPHQLFFQLLGRPIVAYTTNGSDISAMNVDDGCGIFPAVASCRKIYLLLYRPVSKADEIFCLYEMDLHVHVLSYVSVNGVDELRFMQCCSPFKVTAYPC